MQRSMKRHSRSAERGATAVFVAFALGILGGFLALVINVGHMMAVRAELQTAADSAALAGAQDLALNADSQGQATTDGLAIALSSAMTFSANNNTDVVNPTLINVGDVTFGQWNGATFVPTAELRRINAVRVQTARSSGSPNGPLDVFMSALLSHSNTTDVGAAAVAAVGGRFNMNCPLLPMTLIGCNMHCGDTFTTVMGQYVDNNVDNIAWTSFNLGANTTTYRDILNRNLCAPVQVGQCINVSNGENNSALQLLDRLYDPTDGSPAPHAGERVSIPVICPSDQGPCPSPSGNPVQQAEVLGFVTVIVEEVDWQGSPKTIRMTVSCGSDQGGNDTGGGPSLGAVYTRPRLVQ